MSFAKSVFKPLKIFKPFVNFPRWMGWSNIRKTSKGMRGMAKDILITDTKSARQETFDQAVKRLGLAEQAIALKKKNLLHLAWFYLALAIALAVYSVYLIAVGKAGDTIITFILTLLALSFAYKQHFRYFQMRKRKLGCTFKEWLREGFRGK